MRMLGAVTLLAMFLGGMVACGTGTDVASGGTGGTGAVAYGTVTDLGSIWVNGVEWETNGAKIYLDSDQAVIGDASGGGRYINRGMVVAVEGDHTDAVSGTAEKITYHSTVTGQVSSASGDTLVVLGQTVLFEPGLTFASDGTKPSSLAALGLSNSDWVEISGLIDNQGKIRARYITKVTETVSRVRGYISVVDANTLLIGALEVTHSSPVLLSDGDFVEVTGTMNGSTLIANSIERLTSELGNIENADDFELEGVARSVDIANRRLTLSGYAVQWDGTTEFDGGLESNLAAGVRLEVEGSLSGGTVQAQSIEFGDAIELEGTLDRNDGTRLTLLGLPNLPIGYATGSTDMIIQTATGTLTHGTKVSVRARESGSGLIATRIEATDEVTDSLAVQGPLSTTDPAANPSILGIPLDNGLIYYLNEQPDPVSLTDFLAALSEGDLVELDGTVDASTGTVTWGSATND